jgi:hypothetical protein
MLPPRAALFAAPLLAFGLAAAALPAGTEGGSPGPGLVTLYSGDPVSHTLNLVDGSFGAAVEGTLFRESRAHLDYGTYNDDALTIALDEDDRGLMVDLGHWVEVARSLGIEEADGGGITFASISVDAGKFRVAKKHPKDSFQDLLAGRPLLSSLAGERRVNLHPVPGHIYLVRIEDHHREAPAVYAKILVVAHRPGESVVLRWEPIPGI